MLLTACATQSPQMNDVEPSVSEEDQKAAQQAANEPTKLALKRKIAVGRLSNETTYGKSLLTNSNDDKMGSKITDMFVQSLINSGNYLVFERPDISLLRNESELSGNEVNIIGVDTLVIGSLTEFGRSTTGESGFLSSSKKQEATATIDLRLVDTRTGQVIESVAGSGSSSTKTARTMGFGSLASYDGSLNDQAIGAAVNAAVEKMTQLMLTRPWSADVLSVEDGLIYFSGGESQGIDEGMTFSVFKKGRPRLAFEEYLDGTPSDYEVVIDGISYGSMSQYLVDENALRIVEGTHLIEIVDGARIVFSTQLFLGASTTRVVKVVDHE